MPHLSSNRSSGLMALLRAGLPALGLLIPLLGRTQVATSYTFSTTTSTYAAITGGTQLLGGTLQLDNFDDEVSAAQTIPAFNYAGTMFTQMYVSANGFITFGAAPAGTNYTPISSSAAYSGAVSAFGTNLQNTNASLGFASREVRWQTVGNEVVVQWKGMRRNGASNEQINFQIRLNTVTNGIQVVYGAISGQTNAVTNQPEVGLRGPNNTFATNVNNRLVGTGSETWAASLAGTTNADKVRFTTASPAKAFTNGLTYVWTACTGPTVSITPAAPSVCVGGSTVLTASAASAYAWTPATGLNVTNAASVTASPSVPTTYTVAATNTGCPFAGFATVTVGVNDPALVSLTASPATICATGTSTLTAVSTGTVSVNSGTLNVSLPGFSATPVLNTQVISGGNGTIGADNVISVSLNATTGTAQNDNLDFYLVGPNNCGTLELSTDNGGTGDNYAGVVLTIPSAAANINTLGNTSNISGAFRTEGTITTAPNLASAITGSYALPATVLSGCPVNGTWTLAVGNDNLFAAATLTGWSLTIAKTITGNYTHAFSGPGTIGANTNSGTNNSTSAVVVSGLSAGTQQFTVVSTSPLNSCTATQTVNVNVVAPPNAGSNGTLITCSNASSSSLFAHLSGSPQAGGAWTGPSTVVGGNYNPATMNPGTYTYTVTATAPCTNATATVTVTENTATIWYADADGDGFGDAAVSQLACGQPGGYVANSTDLCPADANKQAPGACGCGVADVATTYYADVDGDGFGDAASSISGFTCTVPAGYVTNNTDLCTTDANKQAPGQCGCGVADTDSDGDGTANCNDGCPNDPNKVAPGACGCGVADVAVTYYADVDGDGLGDPASALAGHTCNVPAGYVTNSTDDCPAVSGVIGSGCNDNNPFTSGDVLNASCVCTGTSGPCDNWTLTIMTDGFGNQTTWQILDANSPFVLAAGGPYANNTTINASICVPVDACFKLKVNDSGNNGMGNGGYVLRDQNGARVLDNIGNGAAFTSLSSADLPFCSPLGVDKLIVSDCDVENFLPTGTVNAHPNPLVSAQWQVGDQTDDGYVFQFFDPNGGYSRQVFRSHATSGGFGPADATRAAKLGLGTLVTNPLPQNRLLNVRVHGRVNGVDLPWGPVCRFKIDVPAAWCPMTKLIDTPGPTFSCGASELLLDGTSRIWAKPAVRQLPNGNNQVANKYRFHFANPDEGYSRYIVINTYVMVLTQWDTSPLEYGQSYTVTVQASFDGGATYCAVGPSCQIFFAAQAPQQRPDRRIYEMAEVHNLSLWPNPNQGDQVYLTMENLDATVDHVQVDMTDMFGRSVSSTQVQAADGNVNTVLDLDRSMSSGLYVVNITAGDQRYTQRLVVQR